MYLIALSLVSFFHPTVRLPSGQTMTLLGKGPPVVFNSGLFGSMPRRLYTQLFRQMTNNITLVVPNGPTTVTAELVEETAKALSVETVGLFAHSSLDVNILRLPCLKSAVLCDPVVMPRLNMQPFQNPLEMSLQSPSVDIRIRCPTARGTYDASESSPLPEFLDPDLPKDCTTQITFDHVGHADLLDDPWAELGPRVLPWMTGTTTERTTFEEWTERESSKDVRTRYRDDVARLACEHLLKVNSRGLIETTAHE